MSVQRGVRPTAQVRGPLWWGFCWLLLLAFGGPVQGAIQFDIFLGFEGVVPEASWFPIVCEVKNDGPSFNGVIEVEPDNYNQGLKRRFAVELPTGTLKRLTIPVFSATRGSSSWNVRLLDQRGKVRAEQLSVRAAKQPATDAPIVGSLARSPNGMPVLRPILPTASELQPAVARLQTAVFPDNPLVLEGLDVLYLNSERAADLNDAQVKAIIAWVHAGGHLVVAPEQVADINASPWLKELFPCVLSDIRTVKSHPEIQEWLVGRFWRPSPTLAGARGLFFGDNPYRDLQPDLAFEAAEFQVATGRIREGTVLIAGEAVPLMVGVNRGWGRVTALLFNPEREPFRSWKNLPSFWSKLVEVPPMWYVSGDFNQPGGWSCDGIFGAMIDSRQVHKLPITWLLLLLVCYLVVIGPLDQYWLKRIGKPMLTWITFPCYVVVFSLVIYFIGYKLRSGESEWNQLHLVDVLNVGGEFKLRGRSFLSIYSPANQRFALRHQDNFATFRGEFAGTWGGGQSGERASVIQAGEGFEAEVFVPVWSSQLFISDWWQEDESPFAITITARNGTREFRIKNLSDRKFTAARLVVDGRFYGLGELAPGQYRTLIANEGEGTALGEFVVPYGPHFQRAVQSRQYAFGSSEASRLTDTQNSTLAVSFLGQLPWAKQNQYQPGFILPPGLDLSLPAERGNAVLLAWDENYSPIRPIHSFRPRRQNQSTLWRVAIPLGISQPPLSSGN